MKRSIVLMVLMCCAALAAFVIKPTEYLADKLPFIDLDEVVPKAFGDWREVEMSSLRVVDPQAQEVFNTIYQDTLTRTYVNSQGYMVMLSIAYGKSQQDQLQVHKPEACYPAQGFTLLSSAPVYVPVAGKEVPGRIMVAQQGRRIEPLVYWTTIGEHINRGGFHKKFIEMRYALGGVIPDGMLVRISSIDSNIESAHLYQKTFAKEMIMSVPDKYKKRISGLD